MSSKFINPSSMVIGVVGSIAISVGLVLAEAGIFPSFGSEVVNVMWFLCIRRSWLAWGGMVGLHAPVATTWFRSHHMTFRLAIQISAPLCGALACYLRSRLLASNSRPIKKHTTDAVALKCIIAI